MHFIIIAVFNTVCLVFLLLVVEIMFFENHQLQHCVVLKGKYHYRFERSETASTAASTENTCAIWYENVLNIFFACSLPVTDFFLLPFSVN